MLDLSPSENKDQMNQICTSYLNQQRIEHAINPSKIVFIINSFQDTGIDKVDLTLHTRLRQTLTVPNVKRENQRYVSLKETVFVFFFLTSEDTEHPVSKLAHKT